MEQFWRWAGTEPGCFDLPFWVFDLFHGTLLCDGPVAGGSGRVTDRVQISLTFSSFRSASRPSSQRPLGWTSLSRIDFLMGTTDSARSKSKSSSFPRICHTISASFLDEGRGILWYLKPEAIHRQLLLTQPLTPSVPVEFLSLASLSLYPSL